MKLSVNILGAAMAAGLFVGTVAAISCVGAQAPASTVAQRADRILVANQQSANASIVTLPHGKVEHIAVGDGPHEAAVSPDGRFGVISVYGLQSPAGNQLAVIDMATAKVIRTIDLGKYTRPHGLVALAGSPFRVVATSEATQSVITVDVEKGTVLSSVPTGAVGSHMVAVSKDGTKAFTANVGSGSMTALDLVKGTALGTVAIAPRSEGIAVTSDGKEVWVGSNDRRTVTVVNGTTMKVDTVLSGFAVPYRLAISPDDEIVVVAEPEGDRISVIDRTTRMVLGTVAVGGSPRGVTISPDSRIAYVTLGPQNQVVAVDLFKMDLMQTFLVGTAPDGVAFSAK